MAWFHRNSNSTTAGNSIALDVNAGDLIVVCWGGGTGGDWNQTCTFADDLGNTYTEDVTLNSNRPTTLKIFHAVANATFSLTITATPSGTSACIHAACFYHDGGTIPGTVNASASDPNAETVTVTTSVLNALLIGFGDASGSNNPGSGFTAIAQTLSALRCTSQYKLTSANGANTVNQSQGTDRGIIGIAFDPPAGGGTSYTLTCGAGSFGVTGSDASFAVGRTLNAAAGSFSYAGGDTAMVRGRTLSAGAGSFAYAGSDASFQTARQMPAGAGSYAYTGGDAGFAIGRNISAAVGSFSYTGSDANFSRGRTMPAGAGSFSYSGPDAALIYTPASGSFVLTAAGGSFSYNGANAALTAARSIAANSGSFSYTGSDANFTRGRTASLSAGSFAYAGGDVNITSARTLVAGTGVFTYSGGSVAFATSVPLAKADVAMTSSEVTEVMMSDRCVNSIVLSDRRLNTIIIRSSTR